MIDAASGGAVQQWIVLFTTLATGIGGGSLIKALLDHRRQKRAQTDDVALSLVETLNGRIAKLEQDQVRERALCEAQMAVLRHRLNNALQLFEGLLMVMEAAPEKAAEYVSKIKERRAQQEQAEATEKAAIQAAYLAASNTPPEE